MGSNIFKIKFVGIKRTMKRNREINVFEAVIKIILSCGRRLD
jgi:hypothetical protein